MATNWCWNDTIINNQIINKENLSLKLNDLKKKILLAKNPTEPVEQSHTNNYSNILCQAKYCKALSPVKTFRYHCTKATKNLKYIYEEFRNNNRLLAQMNVLCDTSFLMILGSKPLKQIDKLELQFGKLFFLVPDIVIQELMSLQIKTGPKRSMYAKTAIELSYSKFKIVEIPKIGSVDEDLVQYAKSARCAVATIDRNLRNKLMANDTLVITLSKNRLVVASSNKEQHF